MITFQIDFKTLDLHFQTLAYPQSLLPLLFIGSLKPQIARIILHTIATPSSDYSSARRWAEWYSSDICAQPFSTVKIDRTWYNQTPGISEAQGICGGSRTTWWCTQAYRLTRARSEESQGFYIKLSMEIDWRKVTPTRINARYWGAFIVSRGRCYHLERLGMIIRLP